MCNPHAQVKAFNLFAHVGLGSLHLACHLILATNTFEHSSLGVWPWVRNILISNGCHGLPAIVKGQVESILSRQLFVLRIVVLVNKDTIGAGDGALISNSVLY